jgi:DNA-directed RNA polymerase subunit RPC12/RpoP
MAKKLYVCKECGYVFPEELSHIIESESTVFCERCGSPFISPEIQSTKWKDNQFQTKKKSLKSQQEKSSSLEKIIRILDKISVIPLIIVSIVLLFIPFRFLLGVSGILISLYDKKVISKRIRKKDYNKILLDALCLGILGCIIFGTGVILLFKGLMILIYVLNESSDESLYNIGLKMKDSLNSISALGGVIIILQAIDSLIFR